MRAVPVSLAALAAALALSGPVQAAERLAGSRPDIAAAREAGAKWIVLTYHKPVYSASYHALQDTDVQVTREEFVKIADGGQPHIVPVQLHDIAL